MEEITEKKVEEYLRISVKETLHGKAYKCVSPGNDGMPDRMVCLPGGRVVFIETKSPGKVSTKLQKKRQAELSELGFPVFAEVDSKAKVNAIIDYCYILMHKSAED